MENGKRIKTPEGEEISISSYKSALEIISQSTDDYVFLYLIKKNENWFFGDIDKDYKLRDKGAKTNTIEQIIECVHPADKNEFVKKIENVLTKKTDTFLVDFRLFNKRGQTVWVNCRAKVLCDESGEPTVMIGRISEEALRHLVNPLTCLFNQIKLMSDLKEALPEGKGYIMLIDIDDLSAINLSHGRSYGDAILKNLASVLEEIPESVEVYHTERNYFSVHLDVADKEEVQNIYFAIRDAMSDKCTLTAGAVPMDNSLFEDENSLYDTMKIVLRKAKNNGKNNIAFFRREEVEQKVSSIELLEELQESINNGFEGFYIQYQPQIIAGNYGIYSAEALTRYKSKGGERVFPDEFIPVLEQSKLIIQVGLWVLEQALLQCKKWRESIENMRISVNFSMVQFRDKNIVEDVFEILKKTGMDGRALTIEITESIPVHEMEHFKKVIKRFKEAGIQIAIDDFGTGYSNIGYLKQLDVDEIKIDRMFVKDIEADTYNYKVVRNTLDFARMNSIRACCEGVETARELSVLESLSPDIIQGYLFDKPCDPEVFKASYIDSESEEFKKRIEFINKLYHYKDKMSMIRFDPKDILRETNVGLWVIRINEKENYYEMHADETMERIMAVDKKYTPQECYDFWYSRVREDYLDYVSKNVRVMMELNKVVQLEYPWNHPKLGEVIVRCNGKRVKDADGMIVLEGYHRIFSNIEEL